MSKANKKSFDEQAAELLPKKKTEVLAENGSVAIIPTQEEIDRALAAASVPEETEEEDDDMSDIFPSFDEKEEEPATETEKETETFQHLCEELGRTRNYAENAWLCHRARVAYIQEHPETAQGKAGKSDRDQSLPAFRTEAARIAKKSVGTIDALLAVGRGMALLPEELRMRLTTSTVAEGLGFLREMTKKKFDATREAFLTKLLDKEADLRKEILAELLEEGGNEVDLDDNVTDAVNQWMQDHGWALLDPSILLEEKKQEEAEQRAEEEKEEKKAQRDEDKTWTKQRLTLQAKKAKPVKYSGGMKMSLVKFDFRSTPPSIILQVERMVPRLDTISVPLGGSGTAIPDSGISVIFDDIEDGTDYKLRLTRDHTLERLALAKALNLTEEDEENDDE
jgi:hypothetical protein